MYTLAWKKYPDEKPGFSDDDNEIIIARKREGGRIVLNTCNYDASTGEFYFDYWDLWDHERSIIDDTEIYGWICVDDLQHPVEKYKTKVTDLEAFKKKMLNRIDKGDELSQHELLDLVMLCGVHKEAIQYEGWYVDVLSIIHLGTKYFAIKYTYYFQDGDMQCNEQPYEVVETTKTVRDWVPV